MIEITKNTEKKLTAILAEMRLNHSRNLIQEAATEKDGHDHRDVNGAIDQSTFSGRAITILNNALKSAQVTDQEPTKGVVSLGSTIELRYVNGKEITKTVILEGIGYHNKELGLSIISTSSPVGKELLGRTEGETIASKNGEKITIVKITP